MENIVKLTKGEKVKFLGKESSLILPLKADGWLAEGESELNALREQAEALGLKPHHKAGTEKLREMIAVHKEVE